jgi:hypothetical protein
MRWSERAPAAGPRSFSLSPFICKRRAPSVPVAHLVLVRPMSFVRLLLALIVAICCVGCAVSREQARTIATRELARRNLPLPPNPTVQVIRGDAVSELESPYIVWMVEITPPNRKERLYSIYVDSRNGRILDFTKHPDTPQRPNQTMQRTPTRRSPKISHD